MRLFKSKKKLGRTLQRKYRSFASPQKRRKLSRKPVKPKARPKLNPLKYKNKRNVSKIKRIIAPLVIIIIISAGLYLIFLSPFFLFSQQEIIIEESEISENDISQILNLHLDQNLFKIDTIEIRSEIINKFPEIEKIQVKKVFPHKIFVKINSYPYVANIINKYLDGEKKFLINQKGYLTKEDVEDPNMTYVVYRSEKPFPLKANILTEEKLKKILSASSKFHKIFNIKIIDVEYMRREREIHLRTDKNFVVWLDINQSIDNQLNKLRLALSSLDIYNTPLRYIDLRIPGTSGEKIFYMEK